MGVPDFRAMTFPDEPPEAKDWKPDPDTIPKSGPYKGLRCRRDMRTETARVAFERDTQHVESSSTTSGITPWGSSSSPSSSPPVHSSSGPAVSPVAISGTDAIGELPPWARHLTSFLPKRTESPEHDFVHRTQTTERSERTGNTEGEIKRSTTSLKAHRMFVPPHERKEALRSLKATEAPKVPVAAQEMASRCKTAVQETAKDMTSAKNSFPATKSEPKCLIGERPQEIRKLQRPTPVASTTLLNFPYERSLEVRMIRMMEDDLDIVKHASKSELMGMKTKGYEIYATRVKSAHRNWYAAEQAFIRNHRQV